jgi:hypothetical protein
VLKGKVSLENAAGKAIVKKGRGVEVFGQTRAKPRRVEAYKSVSNWINPMRPKKSKGGTILKNLGLVVLFGAIVIGAIFYLQGKQGGEEVSEPGRIQRLDKESPLELKSPYLVQNLSWRTRVVDQKKGENTQVGESEVITRTEVLEADPQKGSRVLLTIEKVKMSAADETWKEATGGMAGRQFEYLLSPEGQLHSFSIRDGLPLKGLEVAFFGNALGVSNTNHLFYKSSVSPGEQWTVALDEEVPGHPNSFMKIKNRCEFIGYGTHKGVEVAMFRDEYGGTIGGGITMGEITERNVTRRIVLDSVAFEGTTDYVMELPSQNDSSGICKVISAEGRSIQKSLKGKMITMIPGRAPIEKMHEEEGGEESRYFITVEYP